MSRTRIAVCLATLALVTLAAPACGGGGGGPAAAAPAVLELALAPRTATFAPGDPIIIDVTLTNVSAAPVAISPLLEAVLIVDRFDRNGTAFPGTTVRTLGESTLAAAQAADLQTLPAGGDITLELRTEFESLAAGQTFLFRSTGPDDIGRKTTYSMAAVGAYEIELRYSYTGDVPAGEPVHVGPTAPATASFAIAP